MGGEAPDQLDGVLGQPPTLGAARVETNGQLGAGAAFPADLDVGALVGRMRGDDHVADEGAQQFLAVAVGGCRRVPQPRQIARQSCERRLFVVGQWRGPCLLERGELPLLAFDGGQGVLERAFEGAGDEAVFGSQAPNWRRARPASNSARSTARRWPARRSSRWSCN